MRDNETLEVPQKGQSLLKVPSRSSSRNQPSPTSTKLSGATATDRSDSIGGGSRESKTSSLVRKRNGSTTSSKMSITQTGATAGPTANTSPTTSSPTTKPKPKKQSFFAKLCCGMPDSANTVEAGEHPVPANKVTKVGERPTTATKPVQTTASQEKAVATQPQSEKDALKRDDAATKPNGQEIEPEPKEKIETAGSGSNADEIRSASEKPVSEAKQIPPTSHAEQSNPSVIVQPPTRAESKVESQQETPTTQKDNEGDIQMQNNEPVRQQEAIVPVARAPEPTSKTSLPPPPPPPVPEPQSIAEPAQKWLLPPIAPRFQGKKCLVLDLDETLVHSSFKVYSHEFARARNHG